MIQKNGRTTSHNVFAMVLGALCDMYLPILDACIDFNFMFRGDKAKSNQRLKQR